MMFNKLTHRDMRTMILSNDSFTVARMSTIVSQTRSSLMAGAKAMMIVGLKKQMMNGVAHFVYMKKDGTIREAWGTTCGTLVAKHTTGTGITRELYKTTAYYDIECGSWRSFRWENIIAVY